MVAEHPGSSLAGPGEGQKPLGFRQLLERAQRHCSEGRFADALADTDRAFFLRPNHPSIFLMRGIIQEHQEQWQAALEAYDVGAQVHPDHVPLLLGLSRVLETLGEAEQALEVLSQLIVLDPPERVSCLLRRAALWWELRKGERALHDYTLVIEAQPDWAVAYHRRGLLFEQLGLFDEALGDLSRAMELAPSVPSYVCSRGLVHRRMAHVSEALADFHHALTLQPDYLKALLQRGSLYEEMGEWTNALRDWSRVLQQEPLNVQALLFRGQLRKRIEEWEGAVADFSRLIETHPSLPRPYLFRSECYEALGKIPLAITDALQALRLVEPGMSEIPLLEERLLLLGYEGPCTYPLPEPPSRAELLAHMVALPTPLLEEIHDLHEQARRHLAQGQEDQALACFNAAIALDPEFFDSYIGRAQVFRAMKELGHAIQDLNAAIQICPRSDHAHHQRALLRFELGDRDGALEDLETSLRLFPHSVDVHNQAGLFHLLEGRWELAMAHFEEVMRLDPTDVSALLHLGTLCLQGQQVGRAITWLDHLLEVAPHDTEALTLRGDAYAQMEMWPQALANWEAVLDLEAHSPAVALKCCEAHRQLRQPWRALEDVLTALELCASDDPLFGQAQALYKDILTSLSQATVPDLRWRFPNVERLLQAGEDASALALAGSLLLCFRDSALLWVLQGRAQQALGDDAAAQSCLEHALALEPDCAEALFYLGLLWADQDEWERCIACLRQAIVYGQQQERHWSLHQAYVQVGLAYNELGQLQDGLHALTLASTLDPDHAFTWLIRGKVHARLEQWDDAIQAFEQTLTLSPDLASPWYERARIYAMIGHRGAALRDLREAIARSPYLRHEIPSDPAFASLLQAPALTALLQQTNATPRPTSCSDPLDLLGHVIASRMPSPS